jgi:hypothetical protein
MSTPSFVEAIESLISELRTLSEEEPIVFEASAYDRLLSRLESAMANYKRAKSMNEELYIIWSEEHGAWWVAGGWGYTRSMFLAGKWTKAETEEILHKANHYLPEGACLNEIAFPAPEFVTQQAVAAKP